MLRDTFWFVFDLAVCCSPAGMSSAASSGSYPGSSERGETHHPSSQEPAPATVRSAWVRVCTHNTGCGAESSLPSDLTAPAYSARTHR